MRLWGDQVSGFHLWKKQKQYAEKNYERYDRTFLGGRGIAVSGLLELQEYGTKAWLLQIRCVMYRNLQMELSF